MAKYAISSEGAAAMRSLASGLLKCANNALESSKRVEQDITELGDTIGIYEDEILGLVSHNCSLLKANYDAILSLAQLAGQKADQIEELVSLASAPTETVSDSDTTNGRSRRLSREEVNSRWKSGCADIDQQIENYKEALLSRNVPDGPWLAALLSEHRSRMQQQFANDLEVARGQSEPREIYKYPPDYTQFYDQLARDYRDSQVTGH